MGAGKFDYLNLNFFKVLFIHGGSFSFFFSFLRNGRGDILEELVLRLTKDDGWKVEKKE